MYADTNYVALLPGLLVRVMAIIRPFNPYDRIPSETIMGVNIEYLIFLCTLRIFFILFLDHKHTY